MNLNEQFMNLVQAQDLIRRVWANQDNSLVGKSLKELDRELTKAMVQLHKMKIST